MTESETQGTWRPARKWREIPAHWWSYVLDGQLWLITEDTFPFHIEEPEHNLRMQLRTRVMYQMGQRQLARGLVLRNADDRPAGGVYLQVLPEGVRIGRSAIDTSLAQAAPRVGLVWVPARAKPLPGVPPIRLVQPDYRAIAARLTLAAPGEWKPVSAAQLVNARHPLTGFLDFCDCGTVNWRVHPVICGAYTQYPLMENVSRELPRTPEEWFWVRHNPTTIDSSDW